VLPLLDLHVAGVQVRAELADLVGVQVVLDGECLELLLRDQAAYLGVVEEDADRCFNVRRVQLCSLLRSFGWVRPSRPPQSETWGAPVQHSERNTSARHS
jgi:hypothetical protein